MRRSMAALVAGTAVLAAAVPARAVTTVTSANGLNWTRMDQDAGIARSESGWDSEMIEYPFVFDHGGQRYMLYNGNGYGKTGFGLAALV